MALKQPKVVVLGGTGWVGRHVTAAFTAASHETVVVARDGARAVPPARFVSLDLVTTPVTEIAAFFAETAPDIIVNAAGRPWGVSETVMRSSLLELTERVVAAVAGLERRPRFVQIGSVMEYGPATEGVPITESTPANPASAYARIKLAASAAVLAAARAGRLDGVVVRLVNIAGPGTAPTSLLGRVMETQLAARRAGETSRLRLTPLRALRDYIDIRDGADAIHAAALGGPTGEPVNIGSGAPIAVRSLVDSLIEISGVPTDLVEAEAVAPASPGAGGDWLAVDPAAAARQLGWKAHRGLDGALRDDWNERLER
ncbi:Nucleoside-diphosphate-sugar epimerase [Amycolatopsis xylanica]|uniref:Nucleoside-diphosphate-sugar epimerase n=1 Tax=Amycolatopsis xylanica TaxID=589385 RepID=A0A1H2VQ02_9PSEU|nr:NAD(P)-dependent oxidoreductase [Amycolatopsis xylanica]SDW70338.1 Nucleoside-diphosphate-sugar epimerase [Amycolatopsis xylanica]